MTEMACFPTTASQTCIGAITPEFRAEAGIFCDLESRVPFVTNYLSYQVRPIDGDRQDFMSRSPACDRKV